MTHVKFVCESHPRLMVGLRGGRYVRFADGQADVTDKAAIEAVKAVADQFGIKAVGGRPSKQDKSE